MRKSTRSSLASVQLYIAALILFFALIGAVIQQRYNDERVSECFMKRQREQDERWNKVFNDTDTESGTIFFSGSEADLATAKETVSTYYSKPCPQFQGYGLNAIIVSGIMVPALSLVQSIIFAVSCSIMWLAALDVRDKVLQRRAMSRDQLRRSLMQSLDGIHNISENQNPGPTDTTPNAVPEDSANVLPSSYVDDPEEGVFIPLQNKIAAYLNTWLQQKSVEDNGGGTASPVTSERMQLPNAPIDATSLNRISEPAHPATQSPPQYHQSIRATRALDPQELSVQEPPNYLQQRQ